MVLEKMLAKHSSGRSENIFFLGAHFKNAREPGCERVVLVDSEGGRGANTYEVNRMRRLDILSRLVSSFVKRRGAMSRRKESFI